MITYLQVIKATGTGAIDAIPADGEAVLVWGAVLYHTAAANATVTLAGADAIRIGLNGAGSGGVMFNVPIYSSVEPNVTVLSAGEIYIYYQTTGSS